LTRALVSDGVEPDKIEYNANKPVEGKAPGGRAGLAVVDVATERWRATLPNCPDHSRATMLEGENPDDSNFGCSSTNNLAVMVSDPRDLVVGETGGHTDAGLTSAAIDRLETDKTKPVSGQTSKSQ
jgi:type IV pilus biogenesis protein CpaD/CtpE